MFDRSIQESDFSRRQVDSITDYAECDAGASSVEENKRWKQVGHVCSIVLTSKHFLVGYLRKSGMESVVVLLQEQSLAGEIDLMHLNLTRFKRFLMNGISTIPVAR